MTKRKDDPMKFQNRTNLYEEMMNLNFIRPFIADFRAGHIEIRDGKIQTRSLVSPESPWIHVKADETKDCSFNLGVLFTYYRVIPQGCMKCWKIVIRPKTLNQLLALLDVQTELGMYSKCGLETRPSVEAQYGGYFYFRTKEDGQNAYKDIRKLIDERLSPDVKMILKRGCTEMEHFYGDSEKWELLPEMANPLYPKLTNRQVEDIAQSIFERVPVSDDNQPEWIKANIIATWIEHAARSGDHTYKKFTGNQPFSPPYRQYQEVA